MESEGDDSAIIEIEKDEVTLDEANEILVEEEVDPNVDEITVEVENVISTESNLMKDEEEDDDEDDEEDDERATVHHHALVDAKNDSTAELMNENDNANETNVVGDNNENNISQVLQSDLLQRRRVSKREKEERLIALENDEARRQVRDDDDSGVGTDAQHVNVEHINQLHPGPSFAERITEHPVFDERFYNRVYDLPFAILQQRRRVPPSLLCKTTPRLFLDGGQGGDLTFLIDNCVPVSDILVDNLGKWTRQGMRTTTRTLFVNDRTICRKGEHDYIVEKRYGIHGNAVPDRSIRKVAWTMRTAFGEQLYSLISYRIADGATVPFKAHGNAKSPAASIYQRILPSSIEKMKILRKTLTPKDITMRMIRSAGGLSSVTDSQALPRNDKQLYNLSRYRCPSSMHCGPTKLRNKPMRTGVEDLYCLPSKGFVQFTHRTTTGQKVFCASQSMIINFKNSCTENIEELSQRLHNLTPPCDMNVSEMMDFYMDENVLDYSKSGPSILIIDQTYDLNDMYLTVFAYRNIRFIGKSNGLHPLCIAAFCLSTRKDEEVYSWAANCLWNLCGSDDNLRVRAFLTDGDPVMDSVKKCPMFAQPTVHIRCGVRLQRNTKMQLREMGASETQSIRILREIYGSEGLELPADGSQRECGMVDCVSDEHFNSTLKILMSHWPIKGFSSYFLRFQAEIICDGYLLPRRVEAGLGRGNTNGITNEIRGMNGILRRYLKQNEDGGFHLLIQTLETFTRGQYMRLGEAIFGFLGEFDLAPDFKHLWMDERTWKSLSVADKKAALFSIGIIEDDLEPASIIPLQNELPVSLQSIYTLHEWRKMMKYARALVDHNEIKRFDEETFAVRDASIVHTVQLISEDVYHCNCSDKRPICTHNLAVSIFAQSAKKFVDRVGERKEFLAASISRRESNVMPPSPVRKRRRREVPSSDYKIMPTSIMRSDRLTLIEDEHTVLGLEDDEDEHVIVEDDGTEMLEWVAERDEHRLQMDNERTSRRPQREPHPLRRFSPEGYRVAYREAENTRYQSRFITGRGIMRRYASDWSGIRDTADEYQQDIARLRVNRRCLSGTEVVSRARRINLKNEMEESDQTEKNDEDDRDKSKVISEESKGCEENENEQQPSCSEIDKEQFVMKKEGHQMNVANDGEQQDYDEEDVDFERSYQQRNSKAIHIPSFARRVTDHPIFDEKFYSRVYDIPVAILQKKREIPVALICREAPMIFLDGLSGGAVSFLVDGSVPVSYLLADNLGKWNGPNLRCTTRTLYLDSKSLCRRGEHDYILEKRYCIHANTTPERSIKKVIWTMRSAAGDQLYSLVSYRIDDGAVVPGTSFNPHMRSMDNYYQRMEPTSITFYDTCDDQ